MRLLLVVALAMVAMGCEKTIKEVRRGPAQSLAVAVVDRQ